MRRVWKYATANRRTYLVWRDMKRRCNNPKSERYRDYGARGIRVCDRWKDDFDVFFLDMGPKPEGLTLERVDNDQGYDPFNCIWATYSVQSLNKRKSGILRIQNHGTRSEYNFGCRCDPCRKSHRDYQRERYRRNVRICTTVRETRRY